MRFYKGLFNGLVLTLLLWTGLFLTLRVFSQEINAIEEKTITIVPVKQVKDIDNIVINPNSKIIHIRTLIKKLDVNGNVLETKRGKDIIIQDKPGNPGTDEIEATEPTTDFTDFIKAIELTKANVVSAIKAYLEKMK